MDAWLETNSTKVAVSGKIWPISFISVGIGTCKRHVAAGNCSEDTWRKAQCDRSRIPGQPRQATEQFDCGSDDRPSTAGVVRGARFDNARQASLGGSGTTGIVVYRQGQNLGLSDADMAHPRSPAGNIRICQPTATKARAVFTSSNEPGASLVSGFPANKKQWSGRQSHKHTLIG